MDDFYLLELVLLTILACTVISAVFPPRKFPRNIPTIPFYVSFLSLYTDLDQKQIYEKYLKEKLEKYGAVKIYFASRWNILVTRPEYLQQMFKEEDVFAKSGNQKKIPFAVLSRYTGDNVISAHGKVWRLYRSVLTHSVQFPEKAPVSKNSEKLVKLIERAIDDEAKCLPVADFLQKYSLQNICESMLGVDFKLLDSLKDQELHQKLKSVKAQIFKPIYMNFPFLDGLPIPSRNKARNDVDSFRSYFTNKVKEAQSEPEAKKDLAGFKLFEALQMGKITEQQFADNVVIILVAGHENPQLLFTSVLYVLAKYPEWQSKVREELKSMTLEEIENSKTLNSILFEVLRMFPPLGQIINRKASRDTLLGSSIHIPKGTYVGYNNFATGRDSSYWKFADRFLPERWGDSNDEILKNYKVSKIRCSLASFHGGRRACLGEKFALFEARVFVKYIVDNFKMELDPTWREKLTPAGPICPMMLRIKFEKIKTS